MSDIQPYHVIVQFGSAINADQQGRAMLVLEKFLRINLEVPAEVFKHTKPDDSKLRLLMTPEQRANL